MLSLFETTSLITLLHSAFLLYIAVQVLVLLLCIALITYKGFIKDLWQFMCEYWQPDYLRHNLLLLSLWISTGLAYLTLLLVSADLSIISLAEAVDNSPLLSFYIVMALGGFLFYVIYHSACLIHSAIKVSQNLKTMRSYRSFRRVLANAKDSPWFGVWGRSAASVSHWISERFVRHFVMLHMRRDLLPFCLSVTGEYLLLMSIVASALMAIEGTGFSG